MDETWTALLIYDYGDVLTEKFNGDFGCITEYLHGCLRRGRRIVGILGFRCHFSEIASTVAVFMD